MKQEDSEVRIPASSGEEQESLTGIEIIPESEPELLALENSGVATPVPPRGGMLRRWTPLLLKFASVQMLVQAIGFAAGIVVVRKLPKQEYAFYTLCNTMLATVLVLADSGISSGMMGIGGRVWQDRGKLSQLIQTALKLRRLLAGIVLPVVFSILIWLLRRNGAPPGKIGILVLIVLAGCGLELVTRVYVVALRLRSEVRQIQRQALLAGIVKIAVVGVAALAYFNVEIAVIAVAAGYGVQYWMLRQWSREHLDLNAECDPKMRSELVSVVKRQSFHAVHHCLESQITIWLISIFGGPENVANVGALSRLAILFSIGAAITTDVVSPAFARLQAAPQVWRRYWQIGGGYLVLCAAMVGCISIFPRQALWILGGRYADLQEYGALIALSMLTGALIDLLLGLNTSRAWIVPPLAYIPFSIAFEALLIWVLNLATIRGVLLLAILTDVPILLGLVGYATFRMRKMQKAV